MIRRAVAEILWGAKTRFRLQIRGRWLGGRRWLG
jgi:hypothetical protein